MDDSFKNIDFSKQTYWNKRFECEDEYEWFCNFDRLNPVLKEYFINSSMTNHLLHLGCGTSQLAEHLYNKGYCKWITNIDYSPQVMEKMLKKSTYHNINWLVVDIRLMPFVNNTFDIIIEKGTLDVFFVGEHDLWHPSETIMKLMDQVLTKISECLTAGGTFISITFQQPHFRKRFLAKSKYNWSIEVHTIGEEFHYFIYLMTKGNPLNDEDAQLEHNKSSKYYWLNDQTLDNVITYSQSDNEDDDTFLLKIDL